MFAVVVQRLPLLLVCLFFLSACQPKIPKDALKLTPESLAQRQAQSRTFDTDDEAKVLSASAAVLQDLGFNLDESETKLGLVVGSKTRSARKASQIVGSIILGVLSGAYVSTDKVQKMRACLVTRPAGEEKKSIRVHVTFQRIVWNSQNQVTKREGLTDPKIYQEFFSRLSKSLFLEAHEI